MRHNVPWQVANLLLQASQHQQWTQQRWVDRIQLIQEEKHAELPTFHFAKLWWMSLPRTHLLPKSLRQRLFVSVCQVAGYRPISYVIHSGRLISSQGIPMLAKLSAAKVHQFLIFLGLDWKVVLFHNDIPFYWVIQRSVHFPVAWQAIDVKRL